MEEKQPKAADAKAKKPHPMESEKGDQEYPDEVSEELDEVEGEAEPESVLEREVPEQDEVVERTIFEAETPSETGTCTLLSVSYNGSKAKALLKLYEHKTGRTVFWYDNTGHQPYCLTDLPLKTVLADREISGHPGFDRKACKEIKKHDLLHDRDVRMTKVAAKDPLSIGGQGRNIRDLLADSWEDNIRYHDCYIYDQQLIPGYTYRIRGGKVERVDSGAPMTEVREVFKKSTPEFLEALESWLPLFVSPVPDYRRLALDIEVATEALDRIPDPGMARNQVICASLVGSDGLKKVVVLRRPGVEEGEKSKELPADAKVQYFDDELSLLKEIFRYMLDYPILLTFNGDNFDLHYLWRRAQVLGLRKEEVPILMGREIALLPVGVHVDLYKFFHNHAIQIYAFGNAYREVALGTITSALINKGKIPIENTVSELSYNELAAYCFRDSEITLALTTFNSNLVMNLVTMIMRISRLSMEDVTRQGVSRWIRSLFFSEHRAKDCLIPRQVDIESMKGEASTTAIIKGKKYQGAMVIKPESKVYFDVVVMDFASLYPSIISKWNLSYETVRCAHPECKSNLVPDTTHWVCTKRVGMMGFTIGLLRDARVKWFKFKSKDQSISKDERNWYKVVQQALKVILNASYGVFGATIFPLYCLPLADSTTAIGRHIIHETINKATKMGVNVIYGDTDSLFSHKPTKEQIDALSSWADSTFGIDLEVDKRYTFVTFSGRKKNYLGVLESGVVDIKGLMGKKRNTPMFIKSAFIEMTKVLKDVKDEHDFIKAKIRIKQIVQDCYTGLKGRKFSLDELTFRVMLSRPIGGYHKTTPQHVKAAKQLAEKDRDVKPGDIISYVKVQGSLGVKPVQLARIDEVDVDKYVGHIESTFGQVLEALGIEFDEIIGIKKLDFFSR
jgi:DNA polymerase I